MEAFVYEARSSGVCNSLLELPLLSKGKGDSEKIGENSPYLRYTGGPK